MKHAILTGAVHTGKSTVCLKVVCWARQQGFRVRGIITTPMYGPTGACLGLEIHGLESDECRTLARVDCDWGGPRVGPYHFDPATLQWGQDNIEQAIGVGGDLAVVDELGRLELEQAAGFHRALPLLASAAVPRMLVVVRDALLDAFRGHVPTVQFTVFEVTKDNRDRIPEQVVRLLFGLDWSESRGCRGGL